MKPIDASKAAKLIRQIFGMWRYQPEPKPMIGPTLQRFLDIEARGKLFAVPSREIDEDALLAKTRGYRG